MKILRSDWLVLLRQLSYVIKTQVKESHYGHFLPFAVSLWLKADLHKRKGSIKGDGIRNIMILTIVASFSSLVSE